MRPWSAAERRREDASSSELRYEDEVKLELRDEIAARIAASLADSTLSPREIAIRAYGTADALLVERSAAQRVDDEIADQPREQADPGPPLDPTWEVEPRWSRADQARRDAAVARQGPGIAAGRRDPSRPDRRDEREVG